VGQQKPCYYVGEKAFRRNAHPTQPPRKTGREQMAEVRRFQTACKAA
ncbi:TetR family transcriptional regulator, partial [Neisseria macacae ATCC 33926]